MRSRSRFRLWLAALPLLAALGCQGWRTGEHLPEPGPKSAPPSNAAPAPAPPAEAAAPAERSIQVCAVAPSTPAGLRMIPAVVREPADTLVVRPDGERVPLQTAIGSVPLLDDAPWSAHGKTLDLPVNGRVLHYSPYESGRVVDPGDLALIGTADGVPVFVAAADLGPLRTTLPKLLAQERDLRKLLGRSNALRTRLRDVQVLYIPLRATGCVFQPFLRTDLR